MSESEFRQIEPDEWNDSAHPPTDATDLGGGVWVSWTAPWSNPDDVKPMTWHWCTHSVWLAKGADPVRCLASWAPAGIYQHDLVSREPLHIEPSLLWEHCCGMHGFIRDGKWISV